MSGDYRSALEAAGAKVLAFEEFGSYQGDWLAKVEYNGDMLYIRGYYGSCSGCDAFEGEFGYTDAKCEQHRYEEPLVRCEYCEAAAEAHQVKLAAFGQQYLDDPSDKTELVKTFTKQNEWDMDSKDILAWLAAN